MDVDQARPLVDRVPDRTVSMPLCGASKRTNMAYENNDKKFVAVVNRKHPLPVILNALAHAAFGMSGKGPHVGRLLDYPNQATGFSAKVDESPFIILEAKNSSQLQTLVSVAMDSTHVAYNVFTTSMIGRSADAQISATQAAAGEGLDFVLVVLFGPREDVEPLTKRFSLFKG